MCSEMHTAISENRAEIIKDKQGASTQRVQVSALQKRINELARNLGEIEQTYDDRTKQLATY
jgi:hypothetical protein